MLLNLVEMEVGKQIESHIKLHVKTLNPLKSGDPQKGNKQTEQNKIRCNRMQHLITGSTLYKWFSHFSLGIFKSHSLTYLKLKLDASNI